MTSPFDNNHANPWAEHFIDLPGLNAHASNAIIKEIDRVRLSTKGERAEIVSGSILVLGPAGAGKTHLFTRLRRKVGPRAVFVHLRPLIGTAMTPRYVLGEIVRQLDFPSMIAGEPFRQLDSLVGAAFAYLKHEPIYLPRVQLDHLKSLDEVTREEQLEWAIEQIAQRHPEIDDNYANRLLRTPFMTTTALRRASLAWLSGRELEQSQLDRLRVPSGLPEELIMPALKTLGLFATPGAPIVLVFDQLENLMDSTSAGERVRAYANLVAELFDAMRGVVLVQMALDTEWNSAIAPLLGQTQKTRVAAQTTVLKLPSADERRELVRLWWEQLPNRTEPFPAPFGEKRLRAWCDALTMTPRMLMIECRQALAGAPEPDDVDERGPDTARMPDDDDAALAAAWEEHLVHARATLDEASKDHRGVDAARLIGGVAVAFRFVPDAKTLLVDARQPVQLRIERAARSWGVCLLHQMHPKSVIAGLERAKHATVDGPVLLLREQAIEFAPTWKQCRMRVGALINAGCQWLSLERDDVARLLALESFVSAARSGDVEDDSGRVIGEAQVTSWINRTLDVPSWPVPRTLAGQGTATPSVETTAPEKRASVHGSVVEACLTQLRLAALERLIREVARVRPESTRADVLNGLEVMKDRVVWLGHAIVAIKPEEP